MPYFCVPAPEMGPDLLKYAEVAHLVEHDLAKVGVAGSSPVIRSSCKRLPIVIRKAAAVGNNEKYSGSRQQQSS